MKIAACQIEIIWENKKANLKKVETYMKQAKDLEVDFIVFPEMSFTGFSMNVTETVDCSRETCKAVSQLAKKYGIAVGFGWTGAGDEKARNHYSVVDCLGNELSDYVKIHPFRYSGENEYFEAGSRLTLFEIGGFKVSTFVCYDLRFPEIFQAVSKNAELIIVAANWPASRKEHWKLLLRARALENQVYLVGINCIGNMNGLYYSGDSCIIAPDGIVLSEMSEKEGLVLQDIQNDVIKYRDDFPVKFDRIPEWYKKIL